LGKFAAVGFEAPTIRAIAADAGIDPAMVMRYFGTKDRLFAAAAEFDLRFPDFSEIDRNDLATALVRHFLERWESDEALILLLKSSGCGRSSSRNSHRWRRSWPHCLPWTRERGRN
jgi:AcrR family transcriptional regulator